MWRELESLRIAPTLVRKLIHLYMPSTRSDPLAPAMCNTLVPYGLMRPFQVQGILKHSLYQLHTQGINIICESEIHKSSQTIAQVNTSLVNQNSPSIHGPPMAVHAEKAWTQHAILSHTSFDIEGATSIIFAFDPARLLIMQAVLSPTQIVRNSMFV